MYNWLKAFVDTNVLFKITYAISLYRIKILPKKPRILEILESNVLKLYTDQAVITEFHRKLHDFLSGINSEKHGWHSDINEKSNTMIEQLNFLLKEDYLRIVEEDNSLRKQMLALNKRSKRRVCTNDNIVNSLGDFVKKCCNEDVDIVKSLMLAYDLLSTIPKRALAGISRGPLVVLTEDKHLRDFIERRVACKRCACSGVIIPMSYFELKMSLKSFTQRS